MKTRITTLFCALVLMTSLVAFSAPTLFAQTISLESQQKIYKPGENFLVEVSINTLGKSINTVSGSIQIPSNFAVSDIRSGNSIITLWVTNPRVDAANTLAFAGGIPGGYTGSHGQLFSFVLTAKQEGTFSLTQKDTKILLNDGKGTEAQSQAPSLNLTISSRATSSSTTQLFVAEKDTVPPEQFNPIVSRNADFADNQFFVSFLAVDKDSGIAKYDIIEKPFLWFSTSSTTDHSPFVLTQQILPGNITIRAYDRAGNATDVTVAKPPSTIFYIIAAALLLIVLGVCYRWTHRRKNI